MNCPECGKPMTFQDGAIDEEYHVPDFVYCEACGKYGYDVFRLAEDNELVPVVVLYPVIRAKPEDVDCSTAEHTYGWSCPACHGRDCILGNPL